jgi:hypothetical protein
MSEDEAKKALKAIKLASEVRIPFGFLFAVLTFYRQLEVPWQQRSQFLALKC